MVNNQLLDYVKQQLALKVSRDVITANLKGTGWNDIDINEAFATLSITPAEAIEKVQMARVAQVEVQPDLAEDIYFVQ